MSILEWDGYQAAGTKAQTTKGIVFGKDYTDEFGANGLAYSLITNDSQAIGKVRTGSKFDLLHPCAENFKDYVDGGFVQPFDTSLLPSFANLNPALVKGGQFNGQQYAIPWDWGYGSVIYRADMVDPADATGWELFWNPKYKGRISMWNGATTNFEIAALKLGFPQMDNLTSDQLDQATQSLIDQKPLNKFLWGSEYSTAAAGAHQRRHLDRLQLAGPVGVRARAQAADPDRTTCSPRRAGWAGTAGSCSARTRRTTTTRTSTWSRSSTTRPVCH